MREFFSAITDIFGFELFPLHWLKLYGTLETKRRFVLTKLMFLFHSVPN